MRITRSTLLVSASMGLLSALTVLDATACSQVEPPVSDVLASFSTGPSPALSVQYLLTPGTVKQDRNKPRPLFSPDA